MFFSLIIVKFYNRMDTEAYRIRKKRSVAELAQLLGVKEAAVYNYKYGKSKPSYESIEKMLLDGAFISEIFSEEVQKKVIETLGLQSGFGLESPTESAVSSGAWNDPEFIEGFKRVHEEMKAKGLIR